MIPRPFPAELVLLSCLVFAVASWAWVELVALIVDRYRNWR